MTQIFKIMNQMFLVFILFLSIKTVYPAVNYKLSATYYAHESKNMIVLFLYQNEYGIEII